MCICIGDVCDASWLDVAKPAIEERMSRYSASETHFALMSIGKMKSSRLQVCVEGGEGRMATRGRGYSEHSSFIMILMVVIEDRDVCIEVTMIIISMFMTVVSMILVI